MNTNNFWLAYGKLKDGSFVVEETRFPLLATEAEAQAHANEMLSKYNAAPENRANPMVRAWAQQVTGMRLMPEPKEPTGKV